MERECLVCEDILRELKKPRDVGKRRATRKGQKWDGTPLAVCAPCKLEQGTKKLCVTLGGVFLGLASFSVMRRGKRVDAANWCLRDNFFPIFTSCCVAWLRSEGGIGFCDN